MEGLPQFPDGVFLPPMPLNCAEAIFTAVSSFHGAIGIASTGSRTARITT